MTTLGQFRQAEQAKQAEQDSQERIRRSTVPMRAAVDAVQGVLATDVARAISKERWARWTAEARPARAEGRIDWLIDQMVRADVLPEQPRERYLTEQDDPEWSYQEHIL